MRITFYGAAREVTGSMHLIEVNDQRILLECGLFQGRRSETYERNLNFPFDPKTIDALVLSHAHIDHSGNIPNLVKQGFRGNIWCTAATRNLGSYMLLDSGYIQENDVEYLNKKRRKRGEPPVEPLYTKTDAQAALGQLISVGLHRTVMVADGVKATFYNAGHILGSAFVALDIQEHATSKSWRVVFSGDIGREGLSILRSPETLDAADILIVESTYGDRLHEPYQAARKQLRDVIRDTVRRRGKVIIPAFAVERTQEIIYALNQLEAAGDIPELPVFVDSPLAVSATEVFRMHPEEWDAEAQAFLAAGNGRNPFDSSRIEYVRDVRRSKQINFMSQPAVIISASGMAENGRILHHLKNNIENSENTILFVGFQAQDTLGRRILDGVSPVRILGDEYKVRAQVVSIDGYSAHADQAELLAWARPFDRERLGQVFVVHGEQAASFTFAEKLRGERVKQVTVPERGQSFEL
ncbi:MAG: MBL fold metallo-hydrolase [Chloroflexi bacterium HGW-Chloroflexi-1]|nr:MAG: MBL fold metallo-hydrolase [Chloroflexi bacterium HGW-Chloroflexi-1]